MKRLFTRILRFFWSWGFLKFVLFLITLVVLLYAEEDWRGARAWAATKAKWEARGVSFDFNTYLSSPVPDAQNLAALPIFKLEPDPDPDPAVHGSLSPLALHRAIAHDDEAHPLQSYGNWQSGKLRDMEMLRPAIAGQYAAAFPGRALPSTAAAQFAELYPFIAQMREASASRPACRFEQDYDFDSSNVGSSSVGRANAQILLSKFLAWDAACALDAHQTDQALEDIKLNNKLARGSMEQPVLISGLVAVGMIAINFEALYDGLATHAWSDAQLGDMERDLAQLDFLGDYHRLMRGEAVGVLIPALDRFKAQRSILAKGWVDLWKVKSVNMDLTASEWADPEARVFLPEVIAREKAEIDRKLNSWTIYLPWNWLFRLGSNDVVFDTPHKFAQMQVWVDEARIACALERYRLAHKAYPATLDALVPQYIDELPHDVMNGQPYHYRLRADGTFLLYSVGWNQRDDGGVEAKEANGVSRDYTKGDWVWPTAKN
jgi:hypothetical protein